MAFGSASADDLQHQFPCENCGSTLAYTPGGNRLTCESCGHVNRVNPYRVSIKEKDFHRGLELEALDQAEGRAEREVESTRKCQACAAEFVFPDPDHAGECPYCASHIVVDAGAHRRLSPQAVLPFELDVSAAQAAFKNWLGRLWFAPTALSSSERRNARLQGVYIPHWTYDCRTQSSYSGQRGTNYYVQERYQAVENGRTVTRTRTVTKIRWSPRSGRVSRAFDDLVVVASQTLPYKMSQNLQPWPLNRLEAYQPDYLSGFRSEVYQLGLQEGFARAGDQMAPVIRRDVRRDIGGDHQQIHRLNTRYDDVTFKLLLLPVWVASFRYRKKTFRFMVNGCTGQVQGERPYSVTKVALAILLVASVVGLLLLSRSL